MKVYWSFLLLSLIIWYFTQSNDDRFYGEHSYRIKVRENHPVALFVFFGVLTFFCGLRSGIADTGAYILTFKLYPSSLSDIVWEDVGAEKGFYLLSTLFKSYISDDFHGWLFIIALISCIATALAIHRYASDKGFSCFLFIATTMFVYLVNGIRQYICVSILFALSYCLEEKRIFKYLIIVLVLSTIHTSALIMIPVYFLARLRPWSGHTWFIIGGAIILGVGFESFIPMVDSMLSGTDYGHYSELLQSGSGVNIFRLIIAAVPVVLSFFCREQIENTRDKQIPIAVNMSIINLSLYIVANFTSGMTVGRLTAYFDIYNLILIPWLVNNFPTVKERRTLKICAIVGYIIFFYIQMMIAWGGLVYESDILNIYV